MDLIRQQQFDLSVGKGCGGMMMTMVVMKGNRRRADGGTCLCFRGRSLNWLICLIEILQTREENYWLYIIDVKLTSNESYMSCFLSMELFLVYRQTLHH